MQIMQQHKSKFGDLVQLPTWNRSKPLLTAPGPIWSRSS